VKNCGTPLYLTGGTALSRAYYRHRYSDDLDFFVNNDNSFNQYVDAVLDGLRKAGYDWSVETGFVKSPDFRTLVLRHPDFQMGLKLDFVNDVAAHYGEITETDLFYRTDSVRNILSNKVTAIFRMSAKDIVDIHRICLNEKFFPLITVHQLYSLGIPFSRIHPAFPGRNAGSEEILGILEVHESIHLFNKRSKTHRMMAK